MRVIRGRLILTSPWTHHSLSCTHGKEYGRKQKLVLRKLAQEMLRLVFEFSTGVPPVQPELVFGRKDSELAKDIRFHIRRGI